MHEYNYESMILLSEFKLFPIKYILDHWLLQNIKLQNRLQRKIFTASYMITAIIITAIIIIIAYIFFYFFNINGQVCISSKYF